MLNTFQIALTHSTFAHTNCLNTPVLLANKPSLFSNHLKQVSQKNDDFDATNNQRLTQRPNDVSNHKNKKHKFVYRHQHLRFGRHVPHFSLNEKLDLLYSEYQQAIQECKTKYKDDDELYQRDCQEQRCQEYVSNSCALTDPHHPILCKFLNSEQACFKTPEPIETLPPKAKLNSKRSLRKKPLNK